MEIEFNLTAQEMQKRNPEWNKEQCERFVEKYLPLIETRVSCEADDILEDFEAEFQDEVDEENAELEAEQEEDEEEEEDE